MPAYIRLLAYFSNFILLASFLGIGIGCLLARRDKLEMLQRPWFSGGTISIASVQGDGHHLHHDETAFEDGTVDYLNLPAVSTGLR